MNLLPDFIRRRLDHQLDLSRIIDNIGWLFVDKIIRMTLGLFVGVWFARYLGPEQFGLFNYAAAFVAMFGVIASLGLNSIVVRDLVQCPATAQVTMATAFTMQCFGGLVAFLCCTVLMTWLWPDDSYTRAIVAIMAFSLVFKSSDVIKYWFESTVQSKYPVWAGIAVFLTVATAKIGLILLGASIMSFVWLVLIEAVLIAVAMLCLYSRKQGALRVRLFQWRRAKTLLVDSWHLMLSGVAVVIYMRIDQIMLGNMVGNGAVGTYSAALQLSEVWYFIPAVIVASIYPSIIDAKNRDKAAYERRIQKLLTLVVMIAFAIALPISLGSDILIQFLYGQEFDGAQTVLTVHMWGAIFVSLGVASTNWFVLEGLQRLAFYRTALGAVVNILANLFLIPEYGVIGAAFGTLLSQVVAAYLFDAFGAKTRPLFWMKTKALIPILPKRA